MRARLVRRLVLAVAAVWLLSTAGLAYAASRDLEAGVAAVEAARGGLTPEGLTTGEPAGALASARRHFGTAAVRLRRPVFVPLRYLPIVGRQLRSVSALAEAAEQVAFAGEKGVREASRAFEQAPQDGPGRVALLGRLREIVAEARVDLRDLDLGPERALIAPLASRRARLQSELTEAREGLESADAALGALSDLLGQPRRYLLLAANNAEMRAGSGAFLSVGVLHSGGDGRVQLGDLESAGDLLLPPPGVPITDPDLAARWGWMEPGREWRNLGASPRFDVNAALAASMWETARRETVDGVLALDVAAVRAVLAATGPVEVEGKEITAEGVDDLLLHDQYLSLDPRLRGDQAARREHLGQIAQAAVNALDDGDLSVTDLSGELARAASGRHVLVWSRDATVQAGWAAAGLSGQLLGDELLLGIMNRGANKLDRFLRADAGISTRRVGADTDVTVRLTLTNSTPDGEPAYVAGPDARVAAAAGEYVGIVALTLPAAATAATVEGGGKLAALGADGPASVIAAEIRIPRRERRDMTFRFTMPGRHGHLLVAPSARIPPVRWTHGDERWRDAAARTTSW